MCECDPMIQPYHSYVCVIHVGLVCDRHFHICTLQPYGTVAVLYLDHI